MSDLARSHKLLVANRGEIAIRIATAAGALGIDTVAVHSEDDATCLHVRRADEVAALSGVGPAAYLDAAGLIDVARRTGCDLVHPGYGFLAESAAFAARCAEAGLTFVGPTAETLALLGDKARARDFAREQGTPVLDGSHGPTGLDEARAFFRALGAGARAVIKAVAGGGGRGMRVVERAEDLPEAFARCQSEAEAAFGDGSLFIERLVDVARHVEVQILGDGSGEVSHLFERECSVQRRHQKVVEVAPAPFLADAMRAALLESAVRMARAARYRGLGTFEYLVDASDAPLAPGYWFIEANARLQVEHTVTEAVLGVDLVQAQIRVALGESLGDVGLAQSDVGAPRGYAIQARVNMETTSASGEPRPAGGTLSDFDVPSGPGVRVDTFGYRGYATSPRFDSLLAKVVVHGASGRFVDVARQCERVLSTFRVGGVATNLSLLRAIVSHPAFLEGRVTTRFVESHAAELTRDHAQVARYFEGPASRGHAGARLGSSDPLAVLEYGKSEGAAPVAAEEASVPDGMRAVSAPIQGSIVSVDVEAGASVAPGATLLVMEAMKMEHVVGAPVGGVVREVRVERGDTVYTGHVLVVLEAVESVAAEAAVGSEGGIDVIRADLAEVFERHALGHDERRPEAVEKRRKTGRRTARENVGDLVDAGTFVEYGPLVIAAQRQRRSEEELRQRTPGDGMIAGVGAVNGALFPEDRSQCVVVSYDYTVLAGTQGFMNHRKKDRIFDVAREARLPVVLFAEGGGGRPGDTDVQTVAGLDCMAWTLFGKLSGLVPLVGITTGYCFAGNAVLLGQCDVVIATEGSNIGLGGPAMIEGGGLGVFRPEEVGPMSVQTANGVVDVAVKDEAEAVQVAKQYLAYFQGDAADHTAPDQRLLRSVIPDNRLRVYDVHRVIELLADTGSVLELREGFGRGMVTAFARVEGKTLGIVANNPMVMAGAIDANGADKAARFMQLCDAFDVPLLMLCDTPGIMVGPEAEKQATARHATRLFNIGANLTTPFFTIVLRKGYGLGAMAMAGGTFKAPLFCVGWPTAEFGGMGLEGAVKLGARKALEAIEDPEQRQRTFEGLVAMMYDKGRSVNAATYFEFDDIIDPADSRKWILSVLRAAPKPRLREGKKRPYIDTW